MNTELQKLLEQQVGYEYFSAYLYLELSGRMKDLSFDGIANWLRVQAQEELVHANHIFDYLHERSENIQLPALEKPGIKKNISPLETFEMALKHEKMITGKINDLVTLAMDKKDYATNNFLQWYVDEQVEEESSTKLIADKCKMVIDTPAMLLQLDNELAARVFMDPFA